MAKIISTQNYYIWCHHQGINDHHDHIDGSLVQSLKWYTPPIQVSVLTQQNFPIDIKVRTIDLHIFVALYCIDAIDSGAIYVRAISHKRLYKSMNKRIAIEKTWRCGSWRAIGLFKRNLSKNRAIHRFLLFRILRTNANKNLINL